MLDWISMNLKLNRNYTKISTLFTGEQNIRHYKWILINNSHFLLEIEARIEPRMEMFSIVKKLLMITELTDPWELSIDEVNGTGRKVDLVGATRSRFVIAGL